MTKQILQELEDLGYSNIYNGKIIKDVFFRDNYFEYMAGEDKVKKPIVSIIDLRDLGKSIIDVSFFEEVTQKYLTKEEAFKLKLIAHLTNLIELAKQNKIQIIAD